MSDVKTPDKPLHVRAVAEYSLFADYDGRAWMDWSLGEGVHNGHIEDFEVLTVQPGTFKLQYCLFTVDLWTNPEEFYEDLLKRVQKLLAKKVIGDDIDVAVRWVTLID